MRNFFKFSLIVLIGFIFFSCSKTTNEHGKDKVITENKKQESDTLKPASEKEPEYKNSAYYNNLGKFISGRDIGAESVFYEHTQSPLYNSYKKNLNYSWEQINNSRLSKMDKWFGEEISPVINDSANLFYPFSGPDVLHSFSFYPSAKNYFFIALENTGSIPQFEKMSIGAVGSYFASLNQSIKDVMYISYFLTLKMMKTMTKDKTDGAMAILAMFISRSGYDILDIQTGYMNNKNEFNESKTENYDVPYIKFVIKKDDLSYTQTLYYFKLDLSDGPILKNSSVLDFVKSQGKFNTYAKAASYLMHHSGFSGIRNFIIENSDSVLEDDTAIPYKYFKPDNWKPVLYGIYARPISLFSERYQPDLYTAYSKQGKKLLPFQMGYQVLHNNTSLQFFKRISN